MRIRHLFLPLCLVVFLATLGGCFGRTSSTASPPATLSPTTSQATQTVPTTQTNPVSQAPSTTLATQTTLSGTTTAPSSTTTTPQQTQVPTLPADVLSLLKKSSSSLEGVKNYQLDRTIDAAKWMATDQSDLSTLKVLSQMSLDVAAQKIKMDNDATVSQSQAVSPVIENTIYVVDGTLYVRGLFPEQPELWSKTTVPATYLPGQDQARELINLLLFSPVSLQPRETVASSGQPVLCDVLQGTPDLKEFWALFVNQPGMELPSGTPRGVEYSQFIKNATLKVWLSAENSLPIAAEMSIRTAIGPALMPSLPGDISNVINMRMQFHAYNSTPAIELPEEAKNAEDLRLEQQT